MSQDENVLLESKVDKKNRNVVQLHHICLEFCI